MVRKVFKTGNSLVISLPKDSLDFLELADGADVDVALDRERRQIVIRPAEGLVAGVDETFARQVSEFIEQYRPALEALARE